MLNKKTLLLYTLFFGWFGAHRIYLGKLWQGIAYLMFFWTGIPFFISMGEFVFFLSVHESRLREKYPNGGNAVAAVTARRVILMFLVLFVSANLLVYYLVSESLKLPALQKEMQNLHSAQERYFYGAGDMKYASNLQELSFNADEGIDISLTVTDDCYHAEGRKEGLDKIVAIDCRGKSNVREVE